MENQQTFQNQEDSKHFSEESEYLQNKVRLAHKINMSDIAAGKGTVFEIAEDQDGMPEDSRDMDDFFCDESFIKSLSLGAGSGIFEEEDSLNSDDNAEPFEKMALKMEDISGDGGVLKMEVSPGIGSDIPSGSVITFHYSAFLEYGDEPFDSTILRKKPERRTLDGLDLLPGLNIALKTMRKNETSRFLIKPYYAFGKLGCPPRVPGNETILYEIHVISFVDTVAADMYEEQDQQCATFQEKLEGAKGYHRKGNDLYHEGNLNEAKKAYIRAAWIMEDTKLKNQEEERQWGSVLIKVRSNLAQVFLDLKEPAKACTQCKIGLGIRGVDADDIRSKLLYRYGKAKMMLCDFSGALKELKRAQRLRPHNLDISEALETLLIKKERYEQQEKFMYQRMFQPKDKTNQEGSQSLESSKERKDQNSNILDVRPEFRKVIDDQILEFSANPNINEIPFPNNLNRDEIAYIAAAAKAADLLVTVKPRGMETFLKIAKP